jgi:hypothetical protein
MARVRLVVLICMVAALAAGQARRAGAHTRVGAAAVASDRELEAAIQARFARSKISSNHFQVSVQGGVATLTGRADVLQHKGTATRLARAAGAREVVNRIEISEAARQRASANLAKGRRRAQIKRGEARTEKR